MQNNLNQTNLDAEDALVRDAQQGDDSAFEELTRRHYSSSYKLALSILRDRQEAEDEVQNAYWKAYQHLGQFNRDAKFSTWMTRIVVNQCFMRLRQLRRARFLFIDDAQIGEERGPLELVDRNPDPERELSSTEVSRLLEREIRRIPPLLRKVFLLRDVQELAMPEVARQLGISVPAAKSRLLRARTELRDRLSKYCGDLGMANPSA
jgi:RNA polymerase sigma-70 factor (ECF subfamily)